MHGHSTKNRKADPVYNVWRTMRQRCENPKCASYPYYGGKGVKVCDRWRSFGNFMSDMGPRPTGMTLDRKDADGPYSPDNCRWATRATQTRNRSNTVLDERSVAAARYLLNAGVPQHVLCAALRVGKSTMSMVASKKIWN